MTEEYQIEYEVDPEKTAWGIIGHGLHYFNEAQVGDNKFQRLCYVVRAKDQTILGGIFCATYWDWLYIDLLWLPDELRGRGYGHRLLTLAEEEARRRGAKNAYLDTFSFQAPEFYKQHGYRVFGELPEFPAGHRRYFFTKEL